MIWVPSRVQVFQYNFGYNSVDYSSADLRRRHLSVHLTRERDRTGDPFPLPGQIPGQLRREKDASLSPLVL